MSSYYNIDAILAEEELVPCTNLFDFSHLAHLDPDYVHTKRPSGGKEGENNDSTNRKRKVPGRGPMRTSFLPEGSRIKMPLWAVNKWATLGYARVSMPRHFSQKMRERLEADAASVDLRSRNDRFFMSGMLLVDLVERCSSVISAAMSAAGRQNNRRNVHAAAMAQVSREANELRRTLLLTYAGERLRRTFDWTLSSIDDDVTSFTRRLTELELRMFHTGASAASAHTAWKKNGSRRITVSQTALSSLAIQAREPVLARTVTPDFNQDSVRSGYKRVKVA